MRTKLGYVIIFLLVNFSLEAGVIDVPLSVGQLTSTSETLYLEGFNKLRIPGAPILPAKSYLFALPPGSKVLTVKVFPGKQKLLRSMKPDITPPSLPLSFDAKIIDEAISKWQRNKELLSTLTGTFPAKPVFYSKTSYFRNIPFIRIVYFPVLYENKQFYYYPSCNVKIYYEGKSTTNASVPEWTYKRASQFFSNWESVKHFYNVTLQADSFDYVILTKDTVFAAFDSLVNWKNSIGYHTKLVSVDSVIAQYPGSDTPDKIRNFLVDKYIPWGIHYLLIGGNIDLIPMKICYPDSEHNYDTPTDYYYAELTDDWDSDGDGYYGEYGQDSIGFLPEVIVGRFPFNDFNRLNSVVRKTINFEKDTGNWKENALLLGAFSNFENEDNTGWPSCDGAVLMETIKDSLLSGWTYTRMYEKEGLAPSQYQCEYPLTRNNVVSVWSDGQYSIVPWFGHGSAGGAYRKWWDNDDGDSIPEAGEMSWAPFMYITDAQSLDDMYPSIVFAASCDNAEGDSNIARELIGNGASGVIAATRYGWYTPGWSKPSDGDLASLNYYFYYYLVSQDEKLGDALFDDKVYYFNNLYFPDPWAGDPDWSPQQNLLDYTLFGDPSLVREGVGIKENGQATKLPSFKFLILPNVINSYGLIKFSLPFNGSVNITLYNIAGQRIRVVYKGYKQRGSYQVPFNNKHLSKGIYFVKMKFGGVTKKRKVILF